MVAVAQLVRASDCGSEGRGFESHLPPAWREVVNRSSVYDLFCFMLKSGSFAI